MTILPQNIVNILKYYLGIAKPKRKAFQEAQRFVKRLCFLSASCESASSDSESVGVDGMASSDETDGSSEKYDSDFVDEDGDGDNSSGDWIALGGSQSESFVSDDSNSNVLEDGCVDDD